MIFNKRRLVWAMAALCSALLAVGLYWGDHIKLLSRVAWHAASKKPAKAAAPLKAQPETPRKGSRFGLDLAAIAAPTEEARDEREDAIDSALRTAEQAEVPVQQSKEFEQFLAKAHLSDPQEQRLRALLESSSKISGNFAHHQLAPEREQLFRQRLKEHVEVQVSAMLTSEQLKMFDEMVLSRGS